MFSLSTVSAGAGRLISADLVRESLQAKFPFLAMQPMRGIFGSSISAWNDAIRRGWRRFFAVQAGSWKNPDLCPHTIV
jgi:hypothetical protein